MRSDDPSNSFALLGDAPQSVGRSDAGGGGSRSADATPVKKPQRRRRKASQRALQPDATQPAMPSGQHPDVSAAVGAASAARAKRTTASNAQPAANGSAACVAHQHSGGQLLGSLLPSSPLAGACGDLTDEEVCLALPLGGQMRSPHHSFQQSCRRYDRVSYQLRYLALAFILHENRVSIMQVVLPTAGGRSFHLRSASIPNALLRSARSVSSDSKRLSMSWQSKMVVSSATAGCYRALTSFWQAAASAADSNSEASTFGGYASADGDAGDERLGGPLLGRSRSRCRPDPWLTLPGNAARHHG